MSGQSNVTSGIEVDLVRNVLAVLLFVVVLPVLLFPTYLALHVSNPASCVVLTVFLTQSRACRLNL